MGSITTKNSTSTYANSASTSKNYASSTYFSINNVSHEFLFFARQAPLGATIISAKLQVYNDGAWTGAETLTFELVSDTWSATTLTFAKKPGVTGSPLTIVHGSSTPDATMWELDVTAQMQAVSNGGTWWGWRIKTASGTIRKIWGSKAKTALQPTLVVTWAEAPKAPDAIYPSAGRAVTVAKPTLRANFVDVNANATMLSMQVQINTTASMTSPAFDSGEVANTSGVLPLTSTAYAGLALNGTAYWRVRVKDSAGLWSDWSRVESFQRIALGTAAITLPAVAPNDYVEESSPPINWSYTGTQQNFRAFITTVADPNHLVWDSGKLTTPITGFTLPDNTLPTVDTDYILNVWVWDNIPREDNVEPAYAVATRQFRYKLVGGVTPISAFTGTFLSTGPFLQLDFTRPTPPDYFDVYRDGQPYRSNLDVGDLSMGGTAYRFTDYSVPPRAPHTWMILPKVNGSVPAVGTNPVVTKTVRPNAAWLAQPDGSNAVALFNYDASGLKHAQSGASLQVFDSDQTVQLMGSRGSRQGGVTGRIASYNGVTADQFLARLDAIRLSANPIVYFTYANQSFMAAIDEIDFHPRPKTEEVVYDVSFTLYERKSVV